jgi:hypothetical protein
MGFNSNNWVGSYGGGSFFNPGTPSSSGNGFNYGTDVSKYWDSSSNPTPGKDSTSFDWSKLPQSGDPYGFNKTLGQTKKTPWEGFRAAGEKLANLGQNQYGQGKDSNELTGGGSGKISQSGDLAFAYPEVQVLPPKQSTLSKAMGFLAPFASLIPGVGPLVSAGLGAASNVV